MCPPPVIQGSKKPCSNRVKLKSRFSLRKKRTKVAFAVQFVSLEFFIILLKVFTFSAVFIVPDRFFQILGPIDSKLFDPNYT